MDLVKRITKSVENLQGVKMQKTIEQTIQGCYGDMRKSEQKAADYILEHLENIKELSLDRLAKAARVSQPTVIRMLKALGFQGYREFRDWVIAEMAKDEREEKEKRRRSTDILCVRVNGWKISPRKW